MFYRFSRLVLPVFALGVSAISVVLSGCAGMQVIGSSGGGSVVPLGSGASFSGNVHGGEQSITGSTVRLYAAGTSGYGSAATLLATTTSGGGGQYSFVYGVAGPNTGNSYVCPSPTSQIYITSVGGVTDGSGVPTNTNSAAALLAAIGPCGALTNSTAVYINELTTVGAVTALAQYISPGTTPGTFSIGAPSTTQGQQGLANAVLQLGNLVSSAGGSNSGQITSRTYAGATGALSTVAGVTITATPEATKLNTLADVIAACVNQTSSAGANCVKLFAAATPPPASQTSHPLTALPTATDTVMAAYYMATNPAQIATIGAPCNSTAMACEFSLVSGLSPFQGMLTAAPTDWTIGVTFTTNGTCNAAGDTTLASTGSFFNGPVQEAVDQFGNVWFVNGNKYTPGTLSGTAAPATVGVMSPYGQPLACPGSSTTGGRAISIDPSGNVWVAFNVASTGVAEFLAPTSFVGDNGAPGITGTIATTVPANPTVPLQMVSDKSGNIFYTVAPSAGTATVVGGGETLYELPVGGTAWTQVSSFGQGLSVAAFVPLQIATDSKGRIWVADSSSTGPIYYYPNGTNYTSGTIPSPGTSVLAAYGISVADVQNLAGYTGTGPADVIFSGTTCCGSTSSTTAFYRAVNRFNPTSYTALAAPVYATGISSGQSIGGLTGARSLTVDGAANTFAGGEYPAGGDTVNLNNTFAIYAYNAQMQPISKTGTVPTTAAGCSTTATPPTCATFGGFEKPDFNGGMHGIAVDNSGTVWVLNTGFNTASAGSNQAYNGLSVTQVVGAGVPVGSPLSVMAAAGTLGTAP